LESNLLVYSQPQQHRPQVIGPPLLLQPQINLRAHAHL